MGKGVKVWNYWWIKDRMAYRVAFGRGHKCYWVKVASGTKG